MKTKRNLLEALIVIAAIIFYLLTLVSCQKKYDNCPNVPDVNTITDEIPPRGSYKYGYLGLGHPIFSIDPMTGECHARRFIFLLFSNTKYEVGENFVHISKNDSLI